MVGVLGIDAAWTNKEPSMARIEDTIRGRLEMEALKDSRERRLAEDLKFTQVYVELQRKNLGDDETRNMAKRHGYYHPVLNPGVLTGEERHGAR